MLTELRLLITICVCSSTNWICTFRFILNRKTIGLGIFKSYGTPRDVGAWMTSLGVSFIYLCAVMGNGDGKMDLLGIITDYAELDGVIMDMAVESTTVNEFAEKMKDYFLGISLPEKYVDGVDHGRVAEMIIFEALKDVDWMVTARWLWQYREQWIKMMAEEE